MVLPGHLAGGYLLSKAVLSIAHLGLSTPQTTTLLVIGTLAGDFPDMDLIFYYFNQKSSKPDSEKIDSHRLYPTHVPFYWLVLCIVISLIGFIAGSVFVEMLGAIILAGTWSHFILDSIEYGIRWLYPFSNKRFGLRQVSEPEITEQKGTLRYYWKYVTGSYLKRWTFYAEVGIVLVALIVFLA